MTVQFFPWPAAHVDFDNAPWANETLAHARALLAAIGVEDEALEGEMNSRAMLGRIIAAETVTPPGSVSDGLRRMGAVAAWAADADVPVVWG